MSGREKEMAIWHNKNMKILIIGASGLVGGSLYKEFNKNSHQVIGTYNNFPLPGLFKLDITNKSEVEKVIKKVKPDWVLHPAAYANVDGCERNPELCYKINWQGVKNVVDSLRQNNLPFLFFSTDYIFDGKSGPYKEDDEASPLSVYGKVKLEMENYIKSNLNNYLIIRTCNVFGWEPQGKNFVVRLIGDCPQRGLSPIKIVTDQIGSPTYVGTLTKAIKYLVEKGYAGVYNVSGRETLNRYQFALLIAQVFNLNKDLIKPTTTDQINQAALRPAKGGLKIDKVQAILPFKLPNAREGLEEMKNLL